MKSNFEKLANKKKNSFFDSHGEDVSAKKGVTRMAKKEWISIPLSDIIIDKNIRSNYNDESIQTLAESFKAIGQLEPISVVETEKGYKILYGHRRFFAAQLAGLSEIDCLIKNDFNDEIERIITQISENEEREDVAAIDKENALLMLENEYHLTPAEICEKFHKSQGWYSQIKSANQFRQQHGHLFDEAGLNLTTKDAYKIRDASEEQVKQVIENLKRDDASKKDILAEVPQKKDNRGRKPKIKVEQEPLSNDASTQTEIVKEHDGNETPAPFSPNEVKVYSDIFTRIVIENNKTYTITFEKEQEKDKIFVDTIERALSRILDEQGLVKRVVF
jgi:ParB family chromosome partitioning protein